MDSLNTETESLPSRRYTCIICGRKGRRNNLPEQRKLDPICRQCEHNIEDLESMLIYLPDLIKYIQYKNQ